MRKILLAALFVSVVSIGSAQTNIWTDTFTLTVVKSGIPDLSANSLSILVAEGNIGTAELTLFNTGNRDLGYTLSGEAALTRSPYAPSSLYELQPGSVSPQPFTASQFSPDTTFDSGDWSRGTTISFDLGFSVTFLGQAYSAFSVNVDGTMSLLEGNESLLISTGYDGDDFAPAWVRYKAESDRLVVAWGVDPDATGFDPGIRQVWINADNTVEILVPEGSVGETAVWRKFLAPEWISASPKSGTIPPGENEVVTFTFNAEDTPVGTESFAALITWSDGSSDPITVEVTIEDVLRDLDLPTPFTFSGPAGFITSADITITNSGNVAFSYSIRYPSLNYATTTGQFEGDDGWVSGGAPISADDVGSAVFEIGFPFIFFNTVYTNLIIQADGTLQLAGNAFIQPFSGTDLALDDNADISIFTDESSTRTVVRWADVSPVGSNEDYTFQAILDRDGTIRFNYRNMDAGWPDGSIRLSSGRSTRSGSLVNGTTTTTTTNTEIVVVGLVTNAIIGGQAFTSPIYATNETVVVTPNESIQNQWIQFTPSSSSKPLITASSLGGTIAVNGTADITLTADARTLSAGDSLNNKQLFFAYSDGSDTLNVTFNALGAVPAALSAQAVADMWGTGYEPNIWTEQSANGTRTIRWPQPQDGLSRTYQVLYTPSLTEPFEPIEGAVFTNQFTFIDDDPVRTDHPQGYYKVAVQ